MKSQNRSHAQVRTLKRLDSEELALCPCSYTKESSCRKAVGSQLGTDALQ